MEAPILTIAIVILIVYLILGLSVSLKQAFWINLFSIVSFSVAMQYSERLLNFFKGNEILKHKSVYENSALSFLLVFLVSILALVILYHVLWNEAQANRSENQSGLLKFVQTLLTAAVGWGIGIVIAIGITTLLKGRPNRIFLSEEGIPSLIRTSANLMIQLAKGFYYEKLPTFLSAWIVK